MLFHKDVFLDFETDITFLSIYFQVLGLIFFALGLFIRFGSAVYDKYVDSVKKNIEESASQSGLGTVDLSSFELSSILLGLALAFIFFGLFILAISFLGCCGACYRIKCLLTVVSTFSMSNTVFTKRTKF